MLDILVPHVVLDSPGIVPIVGQLLPAGMAQHVRVNRETDISLFTRPGDDLAHRGRRDRPSALRY
jgi:hypothetical protein